MIKHRMQFFDAEGSPGGGGSILGGEGAPPPAAAAPPAEGAPPASAIGFLNPDGSFKDGWVDTLGDDFKEAAPTLSQYKSLPEVMKALHSTKQLVGKKGVIIPGPDAKPEQIAEYRKAMGVPESPDGYQLKPEKLPEGVDWQDDLAKPFAEIAHKHNIPPAAMQEIVAKYVEHQGSASAIMAGQIEKQFQDSIAELKGEYKSEYDANIALATKTAKIAGVEVSQGFNDPNVVRAMVNLGKMLSEDKVIGAQMQASDNPGKLAAMDIINNKTNPHYALYWAGDAATVKRVQDALKNG